MYVSGSLIYSSWHSLQYLTPADKDYSTRLLRLLYRDNYPYSKNKSKMSAS